MLTKNHAKLTAEIAAHVAADAVVRGQYWDSADNVVGGKGCFIGCLAHSDQAVYIKDMYGLPLPLIRIAENIFEGLPDTDGIAFFAGLPDAVGRDGKDLSKVHWQFVAATLRGLPKVPLKIQTIIDQVIAGIDLLSVDEEWPAYAAANAAYAAADAATAYTDAAGSASINVAYAAAYAAADAADAAVAATDATYIAAYTAAAAADAAAYDAVDDDADDDDADDDARIEQRKIQAALLLKLIADAP